VYDGECFGSSAAGKAALTDLTVNFYHGEITTLLGQCSDVVSRMSLCVGCDGIYVCLRAYGCCFKPSFSLFGPFSNVVSLLCSTNTRSLSPLRSQRSWYVVSVAHVLSITCYVSLNLDISLNLDVSFNLVISPQSCCPTLSTGKTTTMSILTGLFPPSRGDAWYPLHSTPYHIIISS
jgi:hypothetical protein